MPKFYLSCHVTVGAFTTVEAKDEEEAKSIAEGRDVCLGGSGVDQDESWIIEEADGAPSDIVVEGLDDE